MARRALHSLVVRGRSQSTARDTRTHESRRGRHGAPDRAHPPEQPAYRKVDDTLYVIKQGSAYVMISVVPWGDNKAMVAAPHSW